jgi:hypothetical protein
MNLKFIKRGLLFFMGLVLVSFISSCTDDNVFELEDETITFSDYKVDFETKGAIVGVKDIINGFYDFALRGDGVVGFSVLPSGETVNSVNIYKSYNGSTPVLLKSITSFPADVLITLDEAIEGFTSIDEVELGDVITFSLDELQTASGTYPVAAEVSAEVSCTSTLAGVYDAVTTGGGVYGGSTPCSETWEGQVEIVEITGGVFDVFAYDDAHPKGVVGPDMSMGAYWACYSPTTALPEGDLRINEFCNNLFYTGSSQWGETYSFTNIESNGAELTIAWSNDYGEAGSTVLTRTDGTNWPNYTF